MEAACRATTGRREVAAATKGAFGCDKMTHGPVCADWLAAVVDGSALRQRCDRGRRLGGWRRGGGRGSGGRRRAGWSAVVVAVVVGVVHRNLRLALRFN